MRKVIYLLVIVISINSCSGQTENYRVLNDVICELTGDEYMYETISSFYKDSVNSNFNYDVYIKERRLLKDSMRVIFLNNYYALPKGMAKSDFDNLRRDTIFRNNINYRTILDEFIDRCEDRVELDIKKVNPDCGYYFRTITDKRVKYFKPSDRAVLFISNIIYSNDGECACFYLAQCRGGYSDVFVLLKRYDNKWKIVKTVPVSDY
ncbi:MAG: hypothetical protein N4A55_14550 [Vallitalea sp.]|nr:hypothetical protein [Vallitalea sp.]